VLNKYMSFFKFQSFPFKQMVPGSYFGEIDLIHDNNRYYQAAVESKSCILFYLTKQVAH